MCSSLGRTLHPALSIPQLPVVLCLRLESHEISPFHVSMSVDIVLVQVLLGSHVGENSGISRRISCSSGSFSPSASSPAVILSP